MPSAEESHQPSTPSAEDVSHARQLYEQGREYWQRGDRARAISAYEASAALDPSGAGATALEMMRDIMDFYDTNQFNP